MKIEWNKSEEILYSFISIWLEICSLADSEILSFEEDFLLRLAGRDIPSDIFELKLI